MPIYAFAWLQLQLLVALINKRTGRFVSDRGEGVISTAIAVLIIAFLGALMWAGFQTIWKGAEGNIKTQVDNIGK